MTQTTTTTNRKAARLALLLGALAVSCLTQDVRPADTRPTVTVTKTTVHA